MTIFATNLPGELNENDLEEAFGRFGEVEKISLIRNHDTGRSRGFAFIQMPDRREAERAIRNLDDLPWNHHRIIVRPAREHPGITI